MAREKLNHRERLQAVLGGYKPDRFAASFWRHFYHREHSARGTAEAMLDFQKHFDWDFIKINPRADYHTQDWGVEVVYSHDEFVNHIRTGFPIRTPDDWTRIEPLELTAPTLAEHLRAVSLIRRGVGGEVPLLMTVFAPLAVAGRMVADRQLLREHLKLAPDKVHQALQAIADTFERLATELRNAGADGIFFATTQWASATMLTWEQYQEFGLPYDLQVLRASQAEAINILHVCSSENYLLRLLEHGYDCPMVNWDSCDPTNLPLDRAYDLVTDRALVGGVDHNGWLLHSTPEEIGQQIEKIKAAHDPARLIIGPGCSITANTPIRNLEEIRKRL